MSVDAFRLDGRVGIVTGGGGGLGEGISLALAAAGASVCVADIELELAEACAARVRSAGGTATAVAVDVTDRTTVEALARTVERELGGIDVLVNNAAIYPRRPWTEVPEEEWDAVLDTNLKAVFRMSRAVMRVMMKQRYGRIINITSVVGASGNPGQSNYAAAKAGVAGMSRALARELGSRNITVNCIAPGFIATDMTAGLPAEQQKALLDQIPLGRLGRPEEVAHAVLYLASPHAAYVTGQELHVNGGMYM